MEIRSSVTFVNINSAWMRTVENNSEGHLNHPWTTHFYLLAKVTVAVSTKIAACPDATLFWNVTGLLYIKTNGGTWKSDIKQSKCTSRPKRPLVLPIEVRVGCVTNQWTSPVFGSIPNE